MLREVIGNDTTTGDNFFLVGLGVTKGEYGGLSMMLKHGMEVVQDYNVLKYRPTRPHKYTK